MGTGVGRITELVEVAAVLPVRGQCARAVHHWASLPRIHILQVHKQLIVFRLLKIKTTNDVKREYNVVPHNVTGLGEQVHGMYQGLVLE